MILNNFIISVGDYVSFPDDVYYILYRVVAIDKKDCLLQILKNDEFIWVPVKSVYMVYSIRYGGWTCKGLV